MRSKKPVIGLCGGIGAGKSAVAAALVRAGCCLVDSDAITREVQQRPEVVKELQRWWGDRVVDANGRLRRDVVSRIVFEDASEKRRLEALVHPLIARVREDIIALGSKDPAVRAIVLDSPLLFESNLDRLCDAVIFVEADEQQRLERVQRSRGWDHAESRRRESWQLPLAEKRARATHVVPNRGDLNELHAHVASAFERILQAAQRTGAKP